MTINIYCCHEDYNNAVWSEWDLLINTKSFDPFNLKTGKKSSVLILKQNVCSLLVAKQWALLMPGIQTMLEINKPFCLRTDTLLVSWVMCYVYDSEDNWIFSITAKSLWWKFLLVFVHWIWYIEANKILNWNKCHASNLDLCEDQPTFSWCHGLCVFCVSNDVTWAHLSHLNSPQVHSMTLTVDTLTENGANTMWRRNKLAKIQSDINTEQHSPRVLGFNVLEEK